jgi:hypothetical protein
VANWKASGQTAAEFAAGRGYAPATLKWWSSRLNTGAVSGGSPVRAWQGPAVPLARVVVRDELEAAAMPLAEAPIVVELGAVRVLLRRGFDADALRQVLLVLDIGTGGPL